MEVSVTFSSFSRFHAAAKSRATPACERASVLFGVMPISRHASLSIFNATAAGVPTSVSSGRIRIPSCEAPRPSSSSAQIIPIDSAPRILLFLMVKASPDEGYNVVPTVATKTFCPAATFGAPQTICTGSPSPRFTFVIDKRSASGCFAHSITCPTTTPFNPPGIFSTLSTPSTSSPVLVRVAATRS